MSRNPSLEFAWPAVTPRAAAAAWSRELSARLEQYLAAAREHLAAGRPAEAVAAWHGALRDVPGMPVPRRDAIAPLRSEEHTSGLQSREKLVCRLRHGKKKS